MAQTASFHWVVPPTIFVTGTAQYVAAIETALRQLAHFYAPQIEAWMKANAPWTDRTGNARASLYTSVLDTLGEIAVLVSHGVNYGLWLEYRNAGAYGIISPAVDTWSQELWRAVKQVMS